MVEARSAASEETAHRGIGGHGLDELEGADEADADTLSPDFLGWGTGFPDQGFEKTRGLLQGGDGHGDVVQRIRKHSFFGA
jgi:hypothetical protein